MLLFGRNGSSSTRSSSGGLDWFSTSKPTTTLEISNCCGNVTTNRGLLSLSPGTLDCEGLSMR
jgi:hypothetical protein